MKELKLQRSLLREVLAKPFTLEKGMELVFNKVIDAPHGDPWKKCKGIDWKRAQQRWIKWFDSLLSKAPPPRDLELLWFEVPSELNPALTSVSGYKKLMSKSDAYGLDEGRCWPERPDGTTLEIGLHDAVELQEMWTRAGWWDASSERRNHLVPGIYATSFCFVALVLRNGLQKTRIFSHLKSAHGIAVVAGWVGGGEEEIGQITSKGWGRLRQIRSESSARPEELDPDSVSFNVKKYIAAGKDINSRDEETGETPLMQRRLGDPSLIREIIRAGADAMAVDKRGCGVLHYFGAAELPTLKLLIEAGANPKLVNREGSTVLDHVVNDGRCTVKHLELYWKLGVRLRSTVKGRNTPIHEHASMHSFNQKLIEFWFKRGFVVDSLRRDGKTPLWIALANHAADLDNHIRNNREFGPFQYKPGDWGHYANAILLLQCGADPNQVYKGSKKQRFVPAGATPLMVQHYRNDRLVKALLKHGANPFATCARGKTALDYARAAAKEAKRVDRKGAIQVVKVLENAMKSSRPKVKLKRKK